MAIKSFPFNSVDKDRTYKAEDFAINQSNLYTNGILGDRTDILQVFSDEGMNIKVNKGMALINGVTMLNNDNYFIKIDIADSVLSRIDKIVLRLDYSARTLVPAIKKGEYASNPIPPELQQDADIWELGLADITVNKGATRITQADIRDLRHTKECGISTFRGMPINLNTIYTQYENSLIEIVDRIREQSYDSTGELQALLDSFKEDSTIRVEDFKHLLDDKTIEILELLNDLNDLIATENPVGELLATKQDKIFKDEVNENKYQIVFKEGRMYKREVE